MNAQTGELMVDLRSDTVTQPTEAMREAMRRAQVGDDGYGEDPTVRRLQEMAASLLGKQDALFVPSGTMANLVALRAHTQHGDEAVVEHEAHVYLDEAGGMASIAGVVPRPVAGDRGAITPELLEAALRPSDPHYAPTRLVCLENTHNSAGGAALTVSQMGRICAAAHARQLRVHLDGARIFNAAVALGVEARELARDADSVMFCLSKGLSAPAGSVLLGDTAFIARARRLRKVLGGAMRQVGVLAAAGIVALETMIERLAEDHLHARLLAEGLAGLPGLRIDQPPVPTNIVMVHVAEASLVAKELAEHGVLANAEGPRRVRLVTHRHVGAADVDRVVEAFREVMAGPSIGVRPPSRRPGSRSPAAR